MIKHIFILITIIGLSIIYANETKTISGFVSDASTGEALIGTNIYVLDKAYGGSTNAYGFYSISIPAGNYEFKYSYVGYNSQSVTINLNKNIKQNIQILVFDLKKLFLSHWFMFLPNYQY